MKSKRGRPRVYPRGNTPTWSSDPAVKREYMRVYSAQRRARLIAEQRCTSCAEPLPMGHALRDCEPCVLARRTKIDKGPRYANRSMQAIARWCKEAIKALRESRPSARIAGQEEHLDDVIRAVQRYACGLPRLDIL